MTTWEYKIIDSRDIQSTGRVRGPSPADAESFLDELGAMGWEVVHLDWRELERRMSFMGLARRERRNA